MKVLITMLFIFHIKLFEQVIMKSYEKEPFLTDYAIYSREYKRFFLLHFKD